LILPNFRGETFKYYVEMACNNMFGNSPTTDILPPSPNRYYTLSTVDLIVPEPQVYDLYYNLQV